MKNMLNAFAGVADTNQQRFERIGAALSDPTADRANIKRIVKGFYLDPHYKDFLVKVSEHAVNRLWEEAQKTGFDFYGRYEADNPIYGHFPNMIVEEANALIRQAKPELPSPFDEVATNTFQQSALNKKVTRAYYLDVPFIRRIRLNTHPDALYGRNNINHMATLGHETAHHLEALLALSCEAGQTDSLPKQLQTVAQEFETQRKVSAYISGQHVCFESY